MDRSRTLGAKDPRAGLAELGLAAAAATAWIALLATGDMAMAGAGAAAFAAFQITWLVMMAAMMLPSIVPLTTLLRRAAPARAGEATWLAAASYLVVWSATGAAAYALSALTRPSAVTDVLVLALAGAYQLTPLKAGCLRRCRSPLGFLLAHARPGIRSTAFRLGLRHGAHCVGCCWALMLLFVAGFDMGLGWAGLLAGAVFVEKVTPRGERAAQVLGLALLAACVALVLEPSLWGEQATVHEPATQDGHGAGDGM